MCIHFSKLISCFWVWLYVYWIDRVEIEIRNDFFQMSIYDIDIAKHKNLRYTTGKWMRSEYHTVVYSFVVCYITGFGRNAFTGKWSSSLFYFPWIKDYNSNCSSFQTFHKISHLFLESKLTKCFTLEHDCMFNRKDRCTSLFKTFK